jgi:ferredoxin
LQPREPIGYHDGVLWLCGRPAGCGCGRRAGKRKETDDMAYKITDKCTNCGSCLDSCPVEAISKGEKTHTIDADKCVDCGACQGTCPVEAIEAP